MSKPIIGIIGGTGLGELLESQGGERLSLDTPFGSPSGPLIRTRWNGAEVVFLHRHGPGHRISPSRVPYRANLYAMKSLGVTSILASGATGSLREDIAPGHLVICDQAIDRTFARATSFFDGPLVGHVEFAEPFCPRLRRVLMAESRQARTNVHPSGTYVCMEGPQFSTRAESQLHRSWGADLIGMTCLPEAKLAREAEICYALIAFATDYDCWKPLPPHADKTELLKEIIAHLKEASAHALELLAAAVRQLSERTQEDCPCRHALELGLWTDRNTIPPEEIRRLGPIVRRHFETTRE